MVPAASYIKTTDEEKLREFNGLAFGYLLYSMDDDTCFHLIDTARTANLPERDVAMVWRNFLTRYERRQTATMQQLLGE